MMPSNTKPRYHPIDNPPYQINYRAKRSGKHITCTKRRITFLFGFSKKDAIASGLTEGECRGEEHEVVLIWSHITGKRQIFMDGREIHSSKAAMGNTKFSHAWGIGSHVLKIVANASPSNDGSRQFDLFLDGMSYFEFSQIYQLGTGVKSREVVVARPNSISTASFSQTSSFQSDDARHDVENTVTPPPISELEIDIFEAPSVSCDLLEAKLPSPSYSSYSYNKNPPTLSTTFSSSYSYDEFSPVNASYGGGVHKSFAAISNEILTAYSSNEFYSSTPPINAAPNVPANSNYSLALVAPPMNAAVQAPANGSLALATSQMYLVAQDPAIGCFAPVTNNVPMRTTYDNHSTEPQKPVVSMYNNVEQEQDSVDDIAMSMRKLVNLDDMIKPAASSSTKQQDKSQSLQSLKWARAGRAPTLSEIHSMKSSAGPSTNVMNNPQYQVAPNSMVVRQGMSQQYSSYARAY